MMRIRSSSRIKWTTKSKLESLMYPIAASRISSSMPASTSLTKGSKKTSQAASNVTLCLRTFLEGLLGIPFERLPEVFVEDVHPVTSSIYVVYALREERLSVAPRSQRRDLGHPACGFDLFAEDAAEGFLRAVGLCLDVLGGGLRWPLSEDTPGSRWLRQRRRLP